MVELQRVAGAPQGAAGFKLTASEAVLTERGVLPRAWNVREEAEPAGAPTSGDILPLQAWLPLAESGTLPAGVGVLLSPADDAATLRPYLETVPVIAIDFPVYRDGRGYTHARRLRHIFGYRGTLLARGDVLRDQLHYMWRVGFDAFHLRADQDPVGCLNAFRLFSVFYQYPPASMPSATRAGQGLG